MQSRGGGGHSGPAGGINSKNMFFQKRRRRKRLIVQILCGERIYMKKFKCQKNLLKISFQLNFEFSKSIERFKSYKTKKFKNDQDVCWHDYMEMKMIVWDQSKNDFHLTPKIGPLWGGGGLGSFGKVPKFFVQHPWFQFKAWMHRLRFGLSFRFSCVLRNCHTVLHCTAFTPMCLSRWDPHLRT